MPVYEECKFYIKGGKCKHKDAPHPYHSDCIGVDDERLCCAYNDPVEYTADEKKYLNLTEN